MMLLLQHPASRSTCSWMTIARACMSHRPLPWPFQSSTAGLPPNSQSRGSLLQLRGTVLRNLRQKIGRYSCETLVAYYDHLTRHFLVVQKMPNYRSANACQMFAYVATQRLHLRSAKAGKMSSGSSSFRCVSAQAVFLPNDLPKTAIDTAVLDTQSVSNSPLLPNHASFF